MSDRTLRVAVFALGTTIGAAFVIAGVGAFLALGQVAPGLVLAAILTIMGAGLLVYSTRIARSSSVVPIGIVMFVSTAASAPQFLSLARSAVIEWRIAAATGDTERAHRALAVIVGVPLVIATLVALAVRVGLGKIPKVSVK